MSTEALHIIKELYNKPPTADMQVYPDLIEALPLIEENFLRTPLKEKKLRDEIYSYPRRISMNYMQPPLKDSDSAIVRRLIQKTPKLTVYDLQNHFLNTMRVILSEFSATYIQGRVENFLKGLELSGEPDQLIKHDTKPLMDQARPDALIASKKTEKRFRIRKPFRRRHEVGTHDSNFSKSAKAGNTEAAIPTTATNNHLQSANFCGRGRERRRGSQ
ncbi:hypothetical protein AYI68_g1930 [Smittium mucronatum]|uniref:Uncharacterized protein n=1 Tax=Smittium mucronatum TaxID=133383 RepID=A0A1R0H449_9FUNG|nr:hypothetical protein AYI68_g1930 [Smittium mucronatum]